MHCYWTAPFRARAVIYSGFQLSVQKDSLPGGEDTRVWYRETMFSQVVSYCTMFPCTDPCTNIFLPRLRPPPCCCCTDANNSIANECQMNSDVKKWTFMSEGRDNFAMLEDWLFISISSSI